MADSSIVLVVGPSPEDFAHINQCLSDWECVIVPLNEDETTVSLPPPSSQTDHRPLPKGREEDVGYL